MSEQTKTNKQKVLKQRVLLFLKGMAMGAADVVPGVSGGTIAFIAGIYDELLGAINSITPKAVSILFKQGLAACWQHIHGTFLVILVSGISVSVFTFAHVITYLLEQHPILIWSFFFGLVIASIVYVAGQLKTFGLVELVGIATGTVFILFIAMVNPATPSEGLWFVFVSGSIAICAMILPGISGSFILLLMGMYQYIIAAIKDLDIAIIVAFAAGAGFGLLSFSHVLSWLLKHYHRATFSVLVGFLLGSLYVIWPWKEVLSTVIRHGKETALMQRPVLPSTFEQLTGNEPQILFSILSAFLGFALVMSLESFGNKKR